MKSTVLLVVLALMAASCSKDGEKVANCRTCGETKIVVDVMHHNSLIDTGMVYIKYNTINATTEFDDSAKLVKNSADYATATFNYKRVGNYYIYAKGYDKKLQEGVLGGVPVNITYDYQATGYKTTVPVSEAGH